MWDLKDLGLQAAAHALAGGSEGPGAEGSGTDPLPALARLAADFPAHAAGLSRLAVPPELRKEAAVNRRNIQARTSSFSRNLLVLEIVS